MGKGKQHYGNGKDIVREIALSRIAILFGLAEREFAKRPERSRRYVELARKIGKRNSAKIPAELKKKFCKKCGAYLKCGKNAEYSMAGPVVLVRCKECGAERKARPG